MGERFCDALVSNAVAIGEHDWLRPRHPSTANRDHAADFVVGCEFFRETKFAEMRVELTRRYYPSKLGNEAVVGTGDGRLQDNDSAGASVCADVTTDA